MFPESTIEFVKNALAAAAGLVAGYVGSYGAALLFAYTGLSGLWVPFCIVMILVGICAAIWVANRHGFSENKLSVIFLIASSVAVAFILILPLFFSTQL